MISDYFSLSNAMLEVDKQVLLRIAPKFEKIEETKQNNQMKMLRAFTDCRVASNHLLGSTGYGYDDSGREKLEQVFAKLTGSEAALFRHQFMSGTHTLTVALFGVLRPGDTLLCATGRPYDTLIGVLGIGGSKNHGSLADFGVKYQQLELKNGQLDLKGISQYAKNSKMLYLQRSRGYSPRNALSIKDIETAAKAAKAANPNIVVMVDNCYGEFTRTEEPTQRGADLIAGSLIKNPGAGIAPTGGYISGRADLIELCGYRLSAPGVGAEIGATGDLLRQLYLGLYFAPGVTAEALKSSVYASALFEVLGCNVSPKWNDEQDDIISAIELESPEKLLALCAGIQANSPIDSFVTPEPWPMPGYDCDVIMAAGAFTLGSSIELSCDAPMKAPYTAYMQGGLNFAASRAAILMAADKAFNA